MRWIVRSVGLFLILLSALAIFFILERHWRLKDHACGYHYGLRVSEDTYGIGAANYKLFLTRWSRNDIAEGYSYCIWRIFLDARVNQLGFITPQEITYNAGHPIWVVGAPLWFVAAICGIPGTYLTWRSWNVRRWFKRKRIGCCSKCGYDLRASKDRCPECGTEIPPPAATPASPPKSADVAS